MGRVKCMLCGDPTWKVIYFALPGRLCSNESCCALTGLAQLAPVVASEDEDGEPVFKFMVYEGSYLRALWQWLTAG